MRLTDPFTTPRTSHAPPAAAPVAHPLEAVPGLTGVPRTKVFEDVRNGKLLVRKRGRTSIVEHDEVVRYVKSLPVKEPIIAQPATEIVSDVP
jgi:hypothetical protein